MDLVLLIFLVVNISVTASKLVTIFVSPRRRDLQVNGSSATVKRLQRESIITLLELLKSLRSPTLKSSLLNRSILLSTTISTELPLEPRLSSEVTTLPLSSPIETYNVVANYDRET